MFLDVLFPMNWGLWKLPTSAITQKNIIRPHYFS